MGWGGGLAQRTKPLRGSHGPQRPQVPLCGAFPFRGECHVPIQEMRTGNVSPSSRVDTVEDTEPLMSLTAALESGHRVKPGFRCLWGRPGAPGGRERGWLGVREGRGAVGAEQTAGGNSELFPPQEALATLPTAREGGVPPPWNLLELLFLLQAGVALYPQMGRSQLQWPGVTTGRVGAAGSCRARQCPPCLPSPWLSLWRPHKSQDTRVAQPVSLHPAAGTPR